MNIKVIVLAVVALLVAGGIWIVKKDNQDTKSSVRAGELVIYSGRKEPLILPIIQAFEQKTGVKITLKTGSTEELANLLIQEGESTPADVYIGTDASLLQELSTKELFSPITTEKLQTVPVEYRAPDDNWSGVSGRSRVLIVNTDMIEEDEYPNSMYDIIDPVWKGKVAMAKLTNESVITHISAIHKLRGDDFLNEFLQGVANNDVTLLAGHTDVRKAVARGEFAVGLVNHYYGHLQEQESDNIAIIYPDQGMDKDGAFVNVSGVGIMSSAKNMKEAQRFVDFLLDPVTQKQFAELNFEYPLIQGVLVENAKNLGEFQQMTVSLHEVALERQRTLEIIRDQGL